MCRSPLDNTTLKAQRPGIVENKTGRLKPDFLFCLAGFHTSDMVGIVQWIGMPEIDPLRRIPFLYHFTDRRNLELIRQRGGLFPLAELEDAGLEIPAPGSDE
ncbi:MAG: hypothetical protein ABSH09_32470 [Bryobacteraceae bacterium]